jgi:hypothetical protein
MEKVHRNEKCPCGSGKKYKNCCLKQEIALMPKKRGDAIKGMSELNVNKILSIDDTIGTGLATLLAKNLKLSDIVFPEKEKRRDSDMEVLPSLINLFGNNIKVIPMPDGSVQFKTNNGIVILEP